MKESHRDRLKELHAQLERILGTVPDTVLQMPEAEDRQLGAILAEMAELLKADLLPDSDVEPVFAPVDPQSARPYGKIILLKERTGGQRTAWYDADAGSCCVEDLDFFEARARTPQQGAAAPRRKA